MNMPRTIPSASHSSWSCRGTTLCAAFLLLSFVSRIEATITVRRTGQVFPSEPVKGLGQHMWKGYEYYGRLQYFPRHMNLCDISEPVNVVVPQDSVTVALLASAGGCSKEDQARIASHMIRPKNVVSFLIIEDSLPFSAVMKKSTGKKAAVMEKGDTVEEILETEDAIDSEDEPTEEETDLFDRLSQGILRDDGIQLFVLKVNHKSYGQLLQIVAMEGQADRVNGGTEITLNSKVPNRTVRNILAWAAICLAFCCCCCFCVSLAYQNGVLTIETETEAPPPRPVRRRLTLDQVREKFPSYRYYPSDDAEGPNTDEEEGLERAHQIFGECSICLDDFVPGQRLRQLPCGHVFHSACIARWLVERNAVCPLCKLDVYEEEEVEEESDSSSDDEEGDEAEADPLITPADGAAREPPAPDRAAAAAGPSSSSSSGSWWSFASSAPSSAAARGGTTASRWAMRWLSSRRRRRMGGNGDGDGMLTEMTNPLLAAADRSEPVDEPIGFPAAAARSPAPAGGGDPEGTGPSAATTPESARDERREEEEAPPAPVEV